MSLISDIPFIGALFLAAFGVLLCAFGLKSIQQTRAFRMHGTRYNATVINVATFSHGEGRRTYQPTFRFTDADGQVQTKTTNGGSGSYNYDVGCTQAVLDLPGARTVLVADKRDSDVFGYAVLLAGVLCLAMGLGGIVM